MTGGQCCRIILDSQSVRARVTQGACDEYQPERLAVALRPQVFHGRTIEQLTIAAHEAGHALQHAAWGRGATALRWVIFGRLLLEWDASRRARYWLKEMGQEVDSEYLRASFRGYALVALWRCALVVGLVGLYFLLK